MATRITRIGITAGCLLMAVAGQAHGQCVYSNQFVAGDPATNDFFGGAVAMDGQYALIGANYKTTPQGSSAGEVYGYAPISGTWGQVAHFTAPDGVANARFGSSIGLGGSNQWAVVGAYGVNNSEGKAYIFRRDVNTNLWNYITQFTSGDGSGAQFGRTVAMNKSGTIAAVGAPYADVTDIFGTTSQAGHVLVYVRNANNTWSYQSDLYQSDPAARHSADMYGFSVASDVNGVVTGVPAGDSPTHINCGYINIWSRDLNNYWTATGQVFAPDEATEARFGTAVAMNGGEIAVGAPDTLYAGLNGVGTVYFYRNVNGNWTFDGKVNPTDALPGLYFGSAVSISNNYAVIGSSSGMGRTYVFKRIGSGQWVQEARWKTPSGSTAYFGAAVAIDGTELVTTDYEYNIANLSAAGTAYRFDIPTAGSDTCEGATPVTQGTYQGCTNYASVDGYSDCGTGSPVGPDVWFKYTAPQTGSVTIDTQGSFLDTIVSVHTGCPGTVADSIACNDDFAAPQRWSQITLPVAAGSTYLIRVAGYGGASGGFQLNIGAVSSCYANCDGSTTAPLLNANDFQCFLNKFAANDPYANCDGSTATPTLNANDFQCFLNSFAAGCH